MERELESYVYRKLADRYILRSGLEQVTEMTEWNEHRLKELVRKMGLRRTPGQGKIPIHLTLYDCLPCTPASLLTQIMMLDANAWAALGYAETDRVSMVRYLGSLGCRTDKVLWAAAYYQRPLTLELAKLLIDAGCDPAAQDGDGWDSLVCLACGGHPVDPQVTDLFLATGCRTDLGGRKNLSDKFRLRFDQILKEHAVWKLSRECDPTASPCGFDWGR